MGRKPNYYEIVATQRYWAEAVVNEGKGVSPRERDFCFDMVEKLDGGMVLSKIEEKRVNLIFTKKVRQ